MASPLQLREFLKVQLAQESAPGVTNATATTIMAGLTDIRYRPDDVVTLPPKLDGSLAVANQADSLGHAGYFTCGGYLTFEDILYLLESGYHTVAPSADAGTPIARTRVYRPTLTAQDVPLTYTAQVGNADTGGEVWQYPYSFVDSFEIAARIRDYTTFTSTWRAKDMIELAAFTGSLSPRSVERVFGQQWQFYMDDANLGAMGGSSITDCITDFTFRSGNLYNWSNCMNGLLTPDRQIQQGQQPVLMLTFKLSPTTKALFAAFRRGQKKYIRLVNFGSAIHGTAAAAAPATAPTFTLVAPTGAGLTGAYFYSYTYVYADGGETPMSTDSLLASPTAQAVSLAGITTGPAGVVARRVYRTLTAGIAGSERYLTTIPNNTATTYVDEAPDTSLGIPGPTVGSEYTGVLVRKMVQIDLAANLTAYPEAGQSMSEGAESLQVTFTGSEDRGGLWGKLVEYTVRNTLTAVP